VILFGSHARGEAGRHGDLDFLVIEPDVEHPGVESVRLRRVLGGLVVAADIMWSVSGELVSGVMCVEA
jgi:predicted nucleotidyltransferase